MKKGLFASIGVLIVALLFFVIMYLAELHQQWAVAKVFFILFLILICAGIAAVVIIEAIFLIKIIRKDGFIKTIKPVLLCFVATSLAYLILRYIFRKEWAILESIGAGFLAMVFLLIFRSVRN